MLFVVLVGLLGCVAADVVVCGGFVKPTAAISAASDSPPDFSSIKTTLLTHPDGHFKADTEASPNGYHFIPVYDAGDYTLTVQGPAGWTFSPDHYDVTVGSDGTTTCTEDMDFLLTGFDVSGSVAGPSSCSGSASTAGVKVSLSKFGSVVADAVTAADGSFSFSSVAPGTYTVAASHDLWSVTSDAVTVEVGFGPANVPSGLGVLGYDLSGSIESSDSVGVDAIVLLQAAPGNDAVSAADVACDAPPAGSPASALCASTTDSSGRFVFRGLPCGEYAVVPAPASASTAAQLDVEPASMSASVTSGSVVLSTAFSIKGFSLSGVVRALPNSDGTPGRALAGVNVLVDGQQAAVTDADGQYTLEHLSEGDVTISASSSDMTFEPTRVSVSLGLGSIPDIVAYKYALCGQVQLGDLPRERRAVISPQRRVELRRDDSSPAVEKFTDPDGNFCFQVQPGTYSLKAAVSDAEAAAGLILSPSPRRVTVTPAGGPVSDANFTPAHLSLGGSVSCLDGPCPPFTVSLSGSHQADVETRTGADGAFQFEGLWAGAYTVTVQADHLCWTDGPSTQVTLADGADGAPTVAFTQSGFRLVIDSDQPVEARITGTGFEDVVQLPVGRFEQCLAASGVYNVLPNKCLKFAPSNKLKFDTSDPKALELKAKKVVVKGTVELPAGTDADASSIVVSVDTVNGAVKKVKTKATGNVIKYSASVPLGTTISVGAANADNDAPGALLFYPPSRTFDVPAVGCVADPIPALSARPGVYLSGSITPALEGVQVEVAVRDEDASLPHLTAGTVVTTVSSSADGTYVAGPLHDALSYTLSARKEGYHFKGTRTSSGSDFVHMRLGQVSVTVADESGAGVEGVVLSLSGDGYRRNNMTDADGGFTAVDLFPGSYFLRPMLKEFAFTPSSDSVVVEEGGVHTVKFLATRTAFSMYGTVTSLNGNPQEGVVVSASAEGIAPERTTSDPQGRFRLRGLLPGQTYTVSVKPAAGVSRASPSVRTVTMGNADTTDVNFIVFSRKVVRSVRGAVAISADDTAIIGDLSATLALTSRPEKVVKTAPVDLSRSFLFSDVTPGVYVVRLVRNTRKSNKKGKAAQNVVLPPIDPSPVTVTVTADSVWTDVDLQFKVEDHEDVQEVSMASFFSFAFTVLCVFAVVQRRTVAPVVADAFDAVSNVVSPTKSK